MPFGCVPGHRGFHLGGTYHEARIDFVPTGGGTASSTKIFVSAHNPGVRFVMPYVAISNTSAEVIISGNGFASLTAPVVTFGSVAGAAVQVVSDTEIRVHNPALSAGRYGVTVSSGGQAMTGSPTFVVIDAPTYTYTAFPRTSSNLNGNFTFGRVIYDAERQAIYLLENSEFIPVTDQIERYRFVNGAWVSDPPLAFPIPTSGGFDTFSTIALTPDGQQLLKSNFVTVSHIDPVAWTVTQTADGTGALGADGDLLKGAMSNDGSLILVGSLRTGDTIVRYDSVEKAFYPLPQPSGFQYAESHNALGSAEGDHVGFYFNGGGGVTQSVYDYDAWAGTVAKNPNLVTTNAQVVSYNRDGTRVLLQGVNNMYAALTAHTPPPSGGVFPEIGTPVPVRDAPGLGHNMIITPDGGTLILGGNDHLVIMPAP